MGINIVRIADGDARLYALLGPFALSRHVHQELGGPLYSHAGDQWFFALDDQQVVGFCSLRAERAAYWFDYVYVVEGRRGQGIHTRLADAREAFLATLPPQPVKVVCRSARWPHYEGRGFRVQSRRGDWVYGVRL